MSIKLFSSAFAHTLIASYVLNVYFTHASGVFKTQLSIVFHTQISGSGFETIGTLES